MRSARTSCVTFVHTDSSSARGPPLRNKAGSTKQATFLLHCRNLIYEGNHDLIASDAHRVNVWQNTVHCLTFWKAAIETAMHPLFFILILSINVRTGRDLRIVLSIRKVSIHTCIKQTLACIVSQSLLILKISSSLELPKRIPTHPRLPDDFASLFCVINHDT